VKLLFCPVCQDVIKLGKDKKRFCECGESAGHYLEDGINANIYGRAIPIGFQNKSFVDALHYRPEDGWGEKFKAFVIPRECDTIHEPNKLC